MVGAVLGIGTSVDIIRSFVEKSIPDAHLPGFGLLLAGGVLLLFMQAGLYMLVLIASLNLNQSPSGGSQSGSVSLIGAINDVASPLLLIGAVAYGVVVVRSLAKGV